MSIQFFHPEALEPEELDAFLAAGWFRMRQAVFTCRFVLEGGDLHTAVWVRLPVAGYEFRRSLRRVLKRNDQIYDVDIHRFVASEEMEDLYQVYRSAFAGELAPTLLDALYDDDERDIFDTWQVDVRLDGRLVALSIFDRGRAAVESIMGIWHPDFARHSLGLYTMLVEVRHCRDSGFESYYPGYVAPGCAAFDYKLRLDGMEYLDTGGSGWASVAGLDSHALPSARFKSALDAVETALTAQGVPFRRCLYPLYRLVAVDERLTRCLDTPLFVECHPDGSPDVRVVLTWDPAEETYSLFACVPIANLSEQFRAFAGAKVSDPLPCLELLRPVARLARSDRADGIAGCVVLPDRLRRSRKEPEVVVASRGQPAPVAGVFAVAASHDEDVEDAPTEV